MPPHGPVASHRVAAGPWLRERRYLRGALASAAGSGQTKRPLPPVEDLHVPGGESRDRRS